jgi:hypothetical protein
MQCEQIDRIPELCYNLGRLEMTTPTSASFVLVRSINMALY